MTRKKNDVKEKKDAKEKRCKKRRPEPIHSFISLLWHIGSIKDLQASTLCLFKKK